MSREITDETVTAYHAVERLRSLYDAYRATSRAHVLVLGRLEEGIDDATEVPAERRARDRLRLAQQEDLSRTSEAVMAIRRDQLRRRLLDLTDLPELR